MPKHQEKLDQEVGSFGELLKQYKPLLLMTFGAFSYEFARRALNQRPEYEHRHWGAKTLGSSFQEAIGAIHLNRVNMLPVLHTTIARRHFIKSHNYFCGDEGANYFENVAWSIADFLIQNHYRPELSTLWIGSPAAAATDSKIDRRVQ